MTSRLDACGACSRRTTAGWARAAPRPARAAPSVRVLLFAGLREAAGQSEFDLGVEPGTTVRDLYRALPGLPADSGPVRPARNQVLCAWEDQVAPGDEVAFIPPVSGGAGHLPVVEITPDPLDARRLEAAVAHAGAGAICTFTGVVRDSSEGRAVSKLHYEAYAEMAVAEMRQIATEVTRRWPGARVAMAHRIGALAVGQPSVVVCVSTPHRAEAFAACRWGIDRLKATVPIWKKEFAADGSYWVEGTPAGG